MYAENAGYIREAGGFMKESGGFVAPSSVAMSKACKCAQKPYPHDWPNHAAPFKAPWWGYAGIGALVGFALARHF